MHQTLNLTRSTSIPPLGWRQRSVWLLWSSKVGDHPINCKFIKVRNCISPGTVSLKIILTKTHWMNEWVYANEWKCMPKKKEQKSKQTCIFGLGLGFRDFFFPKWPYLTGPSKGYEKETSLRDSIWLKGLPNACLMPYWKEDYTRFKCYSNWLQPFDDEISLLCVWNSNFTVSASLFWQRL